MLVTFPPFAYYLSLQIHLYANPQLNFKGRIIFLVRATEEITPIRKPQHQQRSVGGENVDQVYFNIPGPGPKTTVV